MNGYDGNIMLRSLVQLGYRCYFGGAMSFLSRYPIGTNVFDREWDALILLDTCRVDALRQVARSHPFIGNVDRLVSLGSTSSEWMAQTFNRDYLDDIRQTVYVSGNAWAEYVFKDRQMPEEHGNAPFSFADWNVVNASDFLGLEQAWKYESDDDSLGHVAPRFITDRAIQMAREDDPERLVVHYSQPHAPYTAEAITEGRDELKPHEEGPKAIRRGVPRSDVWQSYIAHLQYVLKDVELLLNNLDAETVVISADHGEGFGTQLNEKFVYGHGPGIPHPVVKVVPWATTTAEDTGEYEPELEPTATATRTAEGQLQALGYL